MAFSARPVDTFTSFLESGNDSPVAGNDGFSLLRVQGSARALLYLLSEGEVDIERLRGELGTGMVEVGALVSALQQAGLVDVRGADTRQFVTLTPLGRKVAEHL